MIDEPRLVGMRPFRRSSSSSWCVVLFHCTMSLPCHTAGQGSYMKAGSKGYTSVMWHLYFWPLANVSLCPASVVRFIFSARHLRDCMTQTGTWNLPPRRRPQNCTPAAARQSVQTICEMKFQGNSSFAQLAVLSCLVWCVVAEAGTHFAEICAI